MRCLHAAANHALPTVQGIVVAPGVVLHVGPPRIRLLPTSTVLRSRDGLAVLRPASPDLPAPVPAGASQPSTAESHASRLQRMTDAVLQLVGEKYAGVRALGLVGRLLAEGAVGHPGLPPLPAPDGPGDEELTRPAPKSRIQLGRWLCSDVAVCVVEPAPVRDLPPTRLHRFPAQVRAARALSILQGGSSEAPQEASWVLHHLLCFGAACATAALRRSLHRYAQHRREHSR